jgi:hypothetical protein
MQVAVSTVSNLERRIEVSVPADRQVEGFSAWKGAHGGGPPAVWDPDPVRSP